MQCPWVHLKLSMGLNPRSNPWGYMGGGFWGFADLNSNSGGYQFPNITVTSQTGDMGNWNNTYSGIEVDWILPGGDNAPNHIAWFPYQ